MPTRSGDELLDAARGYEALFVPALFGVWTAHMLEAAHVGPGDRVVDIACGTGVLARAALDRVGPQGRVTGVDPAPGMLAAAREIAPGIDWRDGTAEALPLEEGAVDCALCQFGMMFFSDRPAALAEMARVLRPGGRLALAVWNGLDANPGYRALVDLLDDAVGPEAARAVSLPFSLGDPAPTLAALADAGFQDVAVQTRGELARFPSPAVMLEADLRGWLPLFDIHLGEDTIADLLALAETRLADLTDDSGQAVYATSAHIFSARKPRAASRDDTGA